MRRDSINRDYIARINWVLDFLRSHLDEKLSVKGLADIAAFSPSHFNFIFRKVTGESITGYVNRLRLEKAAKMLLHNPLLSVTDVSLECGFFSLAHFSRFFKRHYGCSASEFRDQKITLQGPVEEILAKKDRFTLDDDISPGDDFMFEGTPQNLAFISNVEVKTFSSVRVTYIRVMDGFDFISFLAAFEKLYKWTKARNFFNNESLAMGICHDNPYVSPLDKLRYDACVAVPPGVKGTGEVGAYDLQGGKYAVYRLKSKHKDKMTEAVEVIFDQLILGWLPGSGYQPDDRPYIDIYNGFGERSNGSVFDVDVCLPVKPL